MAEPAKIEFLTRAAGAPGFQTHEVESLHAQGFFRPCRLSDSAWEVTAQPPSLDGSRHFVVRNLSRDRYVLLTAREYFLWELFDGCHSVNEIAKLFHYRFGAFDFALIRQLLAILYSASLLEEPGTSDLQPRRGKENARLWARAWARCSKAWRGLGFKLRDADRYCAALHKYGGFLLFHPVALALYAALFAYAIFAVMRLAPQAKQITLGLAGKPWLSSATMIGTLLSVALCHVTMHALACKAYGRKVRELGFFLLQGVLPTFYADVTDIFMSSRKARVVVDLAGPIVEVVFGSLGFIAAYWSAPGLGQSLLFGGGILLWESALLNLYPFNFLEMDGYNIVSDLLAMPTLRQQALALLANLPRRALLGPRFKKSEWLQIGYLMICLVSVAVYVILHLDAVGLGWPRRSP